MSAQAPLADTHEFTARALLWLQVLALFVGALHFAFATDAVEHPLLAISALAALMLSTLLVRSVHALQSRMRQAVADVIALLICITLLAAASGAARSALLPLYLIPMTSIGLAAGRWSLVVWVAAIIAALVCLLGWFTPGVQIESAQFAVHLLSALAPGAAVALLLAALIHQVRTASQRIYDLASTDALTGLLNLRAFEEVLQQEHRRCERSARNYSLLLVDVDNLAEVNEKMGHDAGSQVLHAVGAAVQRSIRNSDVAARLGGDEFVVLLADANAATAAVIAQRIRNNVWAGTVSVANRLIRANASVGAASYPEDHQTPKELMILADQRMQQDRDLRRAPPRSAELP